MESNYKMIYQSASIKELKHSEYTLISDIEALKYELNDLQEFSEIYLDTKREISELEHEAAYVAELIELYLEQTGKYL